MKTHNEVMMTLDEHVELIKSLQEADKQLAHLAKYIEQGIQPDRKRITHALSQFETISTKLTSVLKNVESHQATQRLKQITPKP